MKKITFFFLFFFSAIAFAQFNSDNVKFYVGSGSSVSYFVVDFKDGTDDRSYVWGVRFDPNQPITGNEMLNLIASEEPNFNYVASGGFLDRIAFNSHDSYLQEYDYWSLWSSSNGNNWLMSGWFSSELINEYWYAATYGYGINLPGPDAPIEPIPAYSSQWFSSSEITTWIGTGTNQSLIIIDFGSNSNESENSFVFGINYNGTLTAQQALQEIQNYSNQFIFTTESNDLTGISFGNYSISNQTAIIYKGTDLSNWETQNNFSSTILTDNDWLGISFSSRRPYIPQDGLNILNSAEFDVFNAYVFPNPSSEIINIEVNQDIKNISIFNLLGIKVLDTKNKNIDISSLPEGIYLIKIATDLGEISKKIIKKHN